MCFTFPATSPDVYSVLHLPSAPAPLPASRRQPRPAVGVRPPCATIHLKACTSQAPHGGSRAPRDTVQKAAPWAWSLDRRGLAREAEPRDGAPADGCPAASAEEAPGRPAAGRGPRLHGARGGPVHSCHGHGCGRAGPPLSEETAGPEHAGHHLGQAYAIHRPRHLQDGLQVRSSRASGVSPTFRRIQLGLDEVALHAVYDRKAFWHIPRHIPATEVVASLRSGSVNDHKSDTR